MHLYNNAKHGEAKGTEWERQTDLLTDSSGQLSHVSANQRQQGMSLGDGSLENSLPVKSGLGASFFWLELTEPLL